jgi:hypothetical protein
VILSEEIVVLDVKAWARFNWHRYVLVAEVSVHGGELFVL